MAYDPRELLNLWCRATCAREETSEIFAVYAPSLETSNAMVDESMANLALSRDLIAQSKALLARTPRQRGRSDTAAISSHQEQRTVPSGATKPFAHIEQAVDVAVGTIQTRRCSQAHSVGGGMRAVIIRLSGQDFFTAIVTMRDWLEKHRCEPVSYRYDQNEDTVVVSVDFAVDAHAKAFAKRFDG